MPPAQRLRVAAGQAEPRPVRAPRKPLERGEWAEPGRYLAQCEAEAMQPIEHGSHAGGVVRVLRGPWAVPISMVLWTGLMVTADLSNHPFVLLSTVLAGFAVLIALILIEEVDR